MSTEWWIELLKKNKKAKEEAVILWVFIHFACWLEEFILLLITFWTRYRSNQYLPWQPWRYFSDVPLREPAGGAWQNDKPSCHVLAEPHSSGLLAVIDGMNSPEVPRYQRWSSLPDTGFFSRATFAQNLPISPAWLSENCSRVWGSSSLIFPSSSTFAGSGPDHSRTLSLSLPTPLSLCPAQSSPQ